MRGKNIMATTRKIYSAGEKPVLTAEQLAELEALKNMPDNEIDLSDSPEQTNWNGSVRGYFTKKRVTIDDDVYTWLSEAGTNPQTRLNEILRQIMLQEKHA